MYFILLHSCPIRTKYLFDKVLAVFSFFEYDYELMFKSVMIEEPDFTV